MDVLDAALEGEEQWFSDAAQEEEDQQVHNSGSNRRRGRTSEDSLSEDLTGDLSGGEDHPHQLYVQQRFQSMGVTDINFDISKAIIKIVQERGEEGEQQLDEDKLQYIVEQLTSVLRSGYTLSVHSVEASASEYNKQLFEAELQPYRQQFGEHAVVIYDAFTQVSDPTVQTSSAEKIRRQPCESFNKITGETDCRLYRSRFQLIKRRCRSNPRLIFQDERRGILVPPNSVVINNADAVNFADTTLQHLLGFLGRDNDGVLCLQGARMRIHITFEQECVFGSGMYCDGHIVIAAGRFKKDRKFWVTELSHPLRDAKCERSIHDCLDLFGGSLSDDDMTRLNEFEWLEKHSERLPSWVAVEEVYLDSAETMKCLDMLFSSNVG
eukprot:GHVS01057271.1.p1 GENE.GHVS01057271.1~~GHVS01057271.1.p1  ORF type:complete len:396 (+),score=53.27 GHVS01057271.1:46-1188(+)